MPPGGATDSAGTNHPAGWLGSRTTGAKCLMLEDGTLKGTIGGAVWIMRFWEKQKRLLKKAFPVSSP